MICLAGVGMFGARMASLQLRGLVVVVYRSQLSCLLAFCVGKGAKLANGCDACSFEVAGLGRKANVHALGRPAHAHAAACIAPT